MKRKAERKVVCVTSEDHEFIAELYKRITDEYVAMASKAGVKPAIGKKGRTQDETHHKFSAGACSLGEWITLIRRNASQP